MWVLVVFFVLYVDFNLLLVDGWVFKVLDFEFFLSEVVEGEFVCVVVGVFVVENLVN